MNTKLFVGIRVTPDLKMRLSSVVDGLQFIPFEGKEYVGTYLDATLPTLQQLRTQRTHLIESLQKFLPDLRTDTLPVVVFPQVFLG